MGGWSGYGRDGIEWQGEFNAKKIIATSEIITKKLSVCTNMSEDAVCISAKGSGGYFSYGPFEIYDSTHTYLNVSMGNSEFNGYPSYALIGVAGYSNTEIFLGEFCFIDVDNPLVNNDKRVGYITTQGGPSAYKTYFGLRNITDAEFNNIITYDVMGNTGFMNTAPTARVHIAGSEDGEPNTAPLKLNMGTILSTEEDGTFEYDGANLYFTIGSTRHTIV